MTSITRREFVLSTAAAVSVGMACPVSATSVSKKTFTILHTNDLHSNLIGVSPSSDYTPFTLNDDSTRGGFSRLATLIAQRREACEKLGPVLYSLHLTSFNRGTLAVETHPSLHNYELL